MTIKTINVEIVMYMYMYQLQQLTSGCHACMHAHQEVWYSLFTTLTWSLEVHVHVAAYTTYIHVYHCYDNPLICRLWNTTGNMARVTYKRLLPHDLGSCTVYVQILRRIIFMVFVDC